MRDGSAGILRGARATRPAPELAASRIPAREGDVDYSYRLGTTVRSEPPGRRGAAGRARELEGRPRPGRDHPARGRPALLATRPPVALERRAGELACGPLADPRRGPRARRRPRRPPSGLLPPPPPLDEAGGLVGGGAAGPVRSLRRAHRCRRLRPRPLPLHATRGTPGGGGHGDGMAARLLQPRGPSLCPADPLLHPEHLVAGGDGPEARGGHPPAPALRDRLRPRRHAGRVHALLRPPPHRCAGGGGLAPPAPPASPPAGAGRRLLRDPRRLRAVDPPPPGGRSARVVLDPAAGGRRPARPLPIPARPLGRARRPRRPPPRSRLDAVDPPRHPRAATGDHAAALPGLAGSAPGGLAPGSADRRLGAQPARGTGLHAAQPRAHRSGPLPADGAIGDPPGARARGSPRRGPALCAAALRPRSPARLLQRRHQGAMARGREPRPRCRRSLVRDARLRRRARPRLLRVLLPAQRGSAPGFSAGVGAPSRRAGA